MSTCVLFAFHCCYNNSDKSIMSYDRPKLFEEDSDLIAANPILTSTYYLKSDHTSQCTLVLTNKSVFFTTLEDRQLKRGFMISFDTIFQILRPKYKPE